MFKILHLVLLYHKTIFDTGSCSEIRLSIWDLTSIPYLRWHSNRNTLIGIRFMNWLSNGNLTSKFDLNDQFGTQTRWIDNLTSNFYLKFDYWFRTRHSNWNQSQPRHRHLTPMTNLRDDTDTTLETRLWSWSGI